MLLSLGVLLTGLVWCTLWVHIQVVTRTQPSRLDLVVMVTTWALMVALVGCYKALVELNTIPVL